MKRSLLTSLATSMSAGTKNIASLLSGSSRPVLRGVVFDMDGTLTKPNLDFGEMYRRCGVDLSSDILEEVAAMPPQQQLVANAIIEEMEEEGRRTLELMPGALEVINWLSAHQIPMAVVTRNTRKSVDVLTNLLMLPPSTFGTCYFSSIIPRDDGYPPKPDPKALEVIADQWNITLPSDSILMVGDSVSNDIVFGKNAGVRTALLDTGRRYQEELAAAASNKKELHAVVPDIVMDDLGYLPAHLWPFYSIESPFNNNLHGLPSPQPTTEFTQAAAEGDLQKLNEMLLLDDSIDIIHSPDTSGNTALVWAADGGHTVLVERLLAVCGSSNSEYHLNRPGYLGATALNRAARRGHLPVLKLLIRAGADLNIPNDKLQYPLHFAAFKQHKDVVQLLLESGANPRVLDRKGRTPAEDTTSESIRDCILQAMLL